MGMELAPVHAREAAAEHHGEDLAAQENAEELKSRGATGNEAVTDKAWWGWLIMMDELFSVLRRATAWVEGCWCHDCVRSGCRATVLQVGVRI